MITSILIHLLANLQIIHLTIQLLLLMMMATAGIEVRSQPKGYHRDIYTVAKATNFEDYLRPIRDSLRQGSLMIQRRFLDREGGI